LITGSADVVVVIVVKAHRLARRVQQAWEVIIVCDEVSAAATAVDIIIRLKAILVDDDGQTRRHKEERNDHCGAAQRE